MNTIQVDIVTPERKVFAGEANMIIAKGIDGEIGVMHGHIPLVTPLKVGPLRMKSGRDERYVSISGGFLEVRPDKITILAETAELPEEIDVSRAQVAKERAEKQLAAMDNKNSAEAKVQKAALDRALLRLDVAKRK
jgi:F-type H+-transporting ATPase subunit epsilon